MALSEGSPWAIWVPLSLIYSHSSICIQANGKEDYSYSMLLMWIHWTKARVDWYYLDKRQLWIAIIFWEKKLLHNSNIVFFCMVIGAGPPSSCSSMAMSVEMCVWAGTCKSFRSDRDVWNNLKACIQHNWYVPINKITLYETMNCSIFSQNVMAIHNCLLSRESWSTHPCFCSVHSHYWWKDCLEFCNVSHSPD